MSADRSSAVDLRGLLDRVEAAPPVACVDVIAAELARILGAHEVSFLIVDYSGQAVVRVVRVAAAANERGPSGRPSGSARTETSPQSIPVTGTVYGRVLRRQETDVRREADGARLVVPVTERGDVVGLLELALARFPDPATVGQVEGAAHALAFVVNANRRHTDLFERRQRSTPMSLAAEIQLRLLPDAFTCEAGQVTIAGRLEPSGKIAGDTFDYALDRDTLHVSITDAVGHGVESAMLATLLVSSLRNGRRRGVALGEQASRANHELAEHGKVGRFVTGQLMRLDLRAGTAQIVNAGHPWPLRLRNGRLDEIELAIDMPFGVDPDREFRVQKLPLEPGDRILFVTDGMLERNAAQLNVAEAFAATADLHPREVVIALGAAVLEATDGKLRDDATVLCLDWYGGPRRGRDTRGGANRNESSHDIGSDDTPARPLDHPRGGPRGPTVNGGGGTCGQVERLPGERHGSGPAPPPSRSSHRSAPLSPGRACGAGTSQEQGRRSGRA